MRNEQLEDIHEFLNKLQDEFEYIRISDDALEIKEACNIIATEIKV